MDASTGVELKPEETTPTAEIPLGDVAPTGPAADVPEDLRWGRVLGVVGVCVLIVGLALVGAMGLASSRPKPPRKEFSVPVVGVQALPVEARQVRPAVAGLGRVRPGRVVRVSAQVAGEVVEVHPGLEDGVVLEAGAEVVRIDRTDLEHTQARLEAQRDGARASLARLEAQAAFLSERIAVAQELVALERSELERKAELLRNGVLMQRDVDTARLSMLRNEDTLLGLRSSEATLAPQLDEARAQVRQVEAQLAEAETDLTRATIRLPLRGQVAGTAVEEGQLVSAGQALFEVWEVGRVEVPVALTLEDAFLLTPSLEVGGEGAAQIEARVVLEGNGEDRSWTGVVRRFEPVDPLTQTVKAVVEVEDASLPAGAFVRVQFTGVREHTGRAIPLSALQERDLVYVVREGRLAIVQVEPGKRVGGWVLVGPEDFAEGDLVIVSPLERAVEGTPLEVVSTELPEELR